MKMISAIVKQTFTRTFTKVVPKKPVVYVKERDRLGDFIAEIMSQKTIKTATDWKTVRNEVLESNERITEKNVDLLTIDYCLKKSDYSLGKSYLKFLQQNELKPNLAATGRFLRLFYYAKLNSEIGNEEDDEILSIYKDLKEKFKAFDSYSSENLILALSKTKQWKSCLEHFEDMKLLCLPQAIIYSAIVSAALRHGEIELGKKLLQEMLDNERIPSNEVYLAYVEYCEKNGDFRNQITDLLQLLQRYDLKIDEEAAAKLVTAAKNNNCTADFVEIDSKGTCKHCSKHLDLLQVTPEEFEQLKKEFMKNVVIGKNVFTKSTPEELQRFTDFVGKMDKFDVVVDGLNVAYSAGSKHSPAITSGFVVAVVNYFDKQRKKILVCGRLHMKKWPKANLGIIYSKASVFLAENLSQDDPYLLYCALACGLNTTIISRDLMRGHLFLLKDPYYKSLFRRWLSQNLQQITFIDQRGRMTFAPKQPYLSCAQKNGDVWHLPYDVTGVNDTIRWICLKL